MRTRLLRTIGWAGLVFLTLPVIRAHEATRIHLKGTELVGLPKNYAPTELDMKTFRLRIAKREMTFSPYLRTIFKQPYDLSISASWYHELSHGPPIISLHIQPKNKDFLYHLALNLDTLDVVGFSVTLQTSDSTAWSLPIELDDQWKKDIRSSIRKLE